MADFGYRVQADRFSAFTRRLVSGLDADHQEKMLRALGLKFLSEVVGGEFETPLDTGRARAGWAALADAEGVRLPLKADAEGEAKGRPEGSFTVSKVGKDVALLIRNAVPYIVYLEYGSSDQAPGGFVRLAMRKMRSKMSEAARELLVEQIAEANVAARAAWTRGAA